MLQGVTDDIVKAVGESGPSVARAVKDAQDTAEVVRVVWRRRERGKGCVRER
jgi:hypothetical protein